MLRSWRSSSSRSTTTGWTRRRWRGGTTGRPPAASTAPPSCAPCPTGERCSAMYICSSDVFWCAGTRRRQVVAICDIYLCLDDSCDCQFVCPSTYIAQHVYIHDQIRDRVLRAQGAMASCCHRWARRSDTRLALSHFRHHKAGRGAQRHRLGAPPGAPLFGGRSVAPNPSLVAPSQRVLCLGSFTCGDHSSRSACDQGQPVGSRKERIWAVRLRSMKDFIDHSSALVATALTGSC